MDKKVKTFQDAQNLYGQFRDAVYDQVAERFPGIVAKSISLADARRADMWKEVDQPNQRFFRAQWEWSRTFEVYQRRPNRFEISLWRAGILGGLCYGKTSRAGSRVRLDLIESSPIRPSPLGGPFLPILAYAATSYAEIVGASEIWVMDPLTELEGVYGRVGFSGRMRYGQGSRIGQRRIL